MYISPIIAKAYPEQLDAYKKRAKRIENMRDALPFIAKSAIDQFRDLSSATKGFKRNFTNPEIRDMSQGFHDTVKIFEKVDNYLHQVGKPLSGKVWNAVRYSINKLKIRTAPLRGEEKYD